jgi:hypothetical protein
MGFNFEDATNARCIRRTRALLSFFFLDFLFAADLADLFLVAVLPEGFGADWPHAKPAQMKSATRAVKNLERITTISV